MLGDEGRQKNGAGVAKPPEGGNGIKAAEQSSVETSTDGGRQHETAATALVEEARRRLSDPLWRRQRPSTERPSKRANEPASERGPPCTGKDHYYIRERRRRERPGMRFNSPAAAKVTAEARLKDTGGCVRKQGQPVVVVASAIDNVAMGEKERRVVVEMCGSQ